MAVKIGKILLRRDTLLNWEAQNPVLDLGEPAYVTDKEELRIGNGTDTFKNLKAITSSIDPESIGTVLHGNEASTPRPSIYNVVAWIGSVEPRNAINNDIWYDTTT